MELDSLYYWDIKKASTGKHLKDGIKMLECIDVEDKSMGESSQKGFNFFINCGQKIYQFQSETETDR